VSRNEVTGPLASGVRIQAGVDGGGSRNRVESVRVTGNVVQSNGLGRAVYVWTNQGRQGHVVAGNVIADVEISGNGLSTSEGGPTVDVDSSSAGGIVLIAGVNGGLNGVISNVRVSGNTISTPHAGIRLIGGWVPTQLEPGDPPQGNAIRCVTLESNLVTGTTVPVHARIDPGPALGNVVWFTVDQLGAFAALVLDRVVDVDASNATGC
jgi:hypothetical protein